MTKKEYIAAHPKSYLARALESNNWTDNQPIEIIGGLDAPYNKCSNLYHALQHASLKEYVRGGHRLSGPDGWWFAVA